MITRRSLWTATIASLWTLAGASGGGAAEPPLAARPSAEAIQQLATTLLGTYREQDPATDLATRFRLELAAGRPAEAEATMARLADVYRAAQPGRAAALVPWRIYARALAEASRQGITVDAAFTSAFAELYGRLGDREATDVLPWYGANLPQFEASFARALAACAGSPLSACPSAIGLATAHQNLAAWSYLLPHSEPLLRADAERRFVIDDQLLVPSVEGAQVAAIVVRPRSTTPVTTLLTFTIYARDDWAFSDAARAAARGYAGVVAYTRGKGRSPGPAVPYVHDGDDAVAVIDWIARQGWSDGRVGMFGGSYNASACWAAARRHPQALKAIATNASNAPGIDTPMEANVFLNFIYPWPFYTTNTKGLDDATYDDPPRWAALNRKWYLSGKPYRALEEIDGTSNPVFAEWLRHPSYDAYWRAMLPFGQEFATIDIPVFAQTGYFDGGQVAAVYYMREHHRFNPAADHRLLLGPYHHTAMQTGVLRVVAGYEVDPVARIDLQGIRFQWFDHVFRGLPLPELLKDTVNFEVMGANLWRHVPSLQDMRTSTLRLFLSDERDGDRYRLTETKPAKGVTELRVDVADRSDVDWQPPPSGLGARNSLVFATAPLAQAMEVDGTFAGRLRVVANKKDLDLSVGLYEQLADGTCIPLAYYIGRASYMKDRTTRHLLRQGKREVLAFESQRLNGRRISAGSRILAVVGVLKQPEMQINYGTGRDVSGESIADAGQALRIRWSSDSFLDLGVRR
jgi:putative CocE/NonD family hydrolase